MALINQTLSELLGYSGDVQRTRPDLSELQARLDGAIAQTPIDFAALERIATTAIAEARRRVGTGDDDYDGEGARAFGNLASRALQRRTGDKRSC